MYASTLRAAFLPFFAATLFLTAAGSAPSALAASGVVASAVPSAELVGKGRMSFLGFSIFDAELYAPDGTFRPARPFALKLTYLRDFKSSDIVESSVKEMRRQGVSGAQLNAWSKQMARVFPNVSAGQSITGVRTAGGSATFYLDGRKLGTISSPGFTDRFFAIWLGNNTRNPQLRAQLIGRGS
ncbi:hypothetical protein FMN50_12025 [Rhodobacterales bacterium]|nr:hypothetical protein FMN50_12025 [Rhodobacterales bacterium]